MAGWGFIEDTGAAQHLRDARIAPIYEGTNGIQAADLVGRKLGLDGGAAYDALLADIRGNVRDARLIALVDAVERIAATMRSSGAEDRLAGSYPYLTMNAVLVAGWLMERIARATAGEGAFEQRTRSAAAYFIEAIVPEALGLAAAAAGGASTIYAVAAEALA